MLKSAADSLDILSLNTEVMLKNSCKRESESEKVRHSSILSVSAQWLRLMNSEEGQRRDRWGEPQAAVLCT